MKVAGLSLVFLLALPLAVLADAPRRGGQKFPGGGDTQKRPSSSDGNSGNGGGGVGENLPSQPSGTTTASTNSRRRQLEGRNPKSLSPAERKELEQLRHDRPTTRPPQPPTRKPDDSRPSGNHPTKPAPSQPSSSGPTSTNKDRPPATADQPRDRRWPPFRRLPLTVLLENYWKYIVVVSVMVAVMAVLMLVGLFWWRPREGRSASAPLKSKQHARTMRIGSVDISKIDMI